MQESENIIHRNLAILFVDLHTIQAVFGVNYTQI